jgi:hypothetical protein
MGKPSQLEPVYHAKAFFASKFNAEDRPRIPECDRLFQTARK